MHPLDQWQLVFSMSLWLIILYFMVLTYRYSYRFKLSKITWILLFLTYTFFVMRGLVQMHPSDVAQIAKRTLGSFSAIAMASTFYFMYLQIYKRKNIQKTVMFVPFATMLAVMIVAVYLPYGVGDVVTATTVMTIIEKSLWTVGGLGVVCHTYLLGCKMSAGRFQYIFMLFQFSAIFAVMWSVLGLSEIFGGHGPEFISETFEFLFMIFSGAAIYVFMKVLRGDD